MDKQQLEAIRARDADDYAAADVLRNIRSAGNTDPELEATINMVADRHALLGYVDTLTTCDLESLRSRLAAQENAARQADERGDEAMRRAHAAEARLAEAERDAARYRFIKQWARRLDITGYSLTNNEHFEPRIDEAMAIASQPSSADVERRPCTCHPDDNPPVPCPRMYALQDCRRAAALRELQQESERLGLYDAERCWIESHSQPPPEDPEFVLVAFTSGDPPTVEVSRAEYVRAYPNEYPFWMPLPAPPDQPEAAAKYIEMIYALGKERDSLAAENTALQRRIALQKGEPTPEQINHFIECAAIELAHARTFVTSRQKMHPDGVELYDMTLNSARAIRDALRAADSASNREIAHDE